MSAIVRQLVQPCLQRATGVRALCGTAAVYNNNIRTNYEPKDIFDGLVGEVRTAPSNNFTKQHVDLEATWKHKSRIAFDSLKTSPVADAFSGRTVKVPPNTSLREAYKRLMTILKESHVSKELRLQMRHEKPGVKRRRLASERWRRVFANEVRKSVQLVAKIRRRGA